MPTLTPKQIARAQKLIDDMPPGDYELNQIYGPQWPSITSPTSFGKMFKAAVVAGLLQNIKHHDLKTNNHHTYAIGNP